MVLVVDLFAISVAIIEGVSVEVLIEGVMVDGL